MKRLTLADDLTLPADAAAQTGVPIDPAAVRERLRGRRVVLSVSGGKDSAATSLYLKELGVDHDRVFADTGWEHELTYAYLRGPLAAALGPIAEVRYRVGLEDLVREKGMFPSRVRRFCTDRLKVVPIRKHLEALAEATGEELVNAVGLRRAESLARSRLEEWEWSETFDCEVWRPIVGWTERDVIEIHRRHGLAPNPLYLMGASRVGCWPCIFARKAEIRLVADTDPARVERIRRLEAELQATAKARYDARGETFESLGYMRPTFFVLDDNKPAQATPESSRKRMFPIDEAVAWARTSRGGRQLQLLETAPEGCVRWGLCETEEENGEAPKAAETRRDAG